MRKDRLKRERFRLSMVLVLLPAVFVSATANAEDSPQVQSVEEERGSDQYEDIPPGHWSDEAVGWAVTNNIMSGVSDVRFDLDGVVPRSQIVTLLYRTTALLGGSTDFQGVRGSDRFDDVPADHQANEYIGWAVVNGITAGVAERRFDPDGSVTRAQIVTFLNRANNLLDGPVDVEGLGSDSFTDLPRGHWADRSVGWALANGITSGVGVNLFGPNRFVTRAQIVTFLFRTNKLIVQVASASLVETFSAVSNGSQFSCALRSDATIVCWGQNDFGQATPPSGQFAAVTAGVYHSCAIRTDRTLDCWGQHDSRQASPPEGQFADLAIGITHSCGILIGGVIACWGTGFDGQTAAPSGEFLSIAAGENHYCGILKDGAVDCWGLSSDGQTAAPPGQFSAISAGVNHSCGIKTDGTVVCWGVDQSGQADPPTGQFSAISASRNNSCGIRTDGTGRLLGGES